MCSRSKSHESKWSCGSLRLSMFLWEVTWMQFLRTRIIRKTRNLMSQKILIKLFYGGSTWKLLTVYFTIFTDTFLFLFNISESILPLFWIKFVSKWKINYVEFYFNKQASLLLFSNTMYCYLWIVLVKFVKPRYLSKQRAYSYVLQNFIISIFPRFLEIINKF